LRAPADGLMTMSRRWPEPAPATREIRCIASGRMDQFTSTQDRSCFAELFGIQPG
jgi:hypothetical protein